MKQVINKLIAHLELYYKEANAELEAAGSLPLEQLEIKVLGQFSLMLSESTSQVLQIAATKDVDALLSGDTAMKLEAKRALRKLELEYDELSKEIWIPETATFSEYYTSSALIILVIDPFSTLTAKAKFALEKNRQLLLQAISVYEEELLSVFRKYDVNINALFMKDGDES